MKPTVWTILEKRESSPPLSSVFRSSFAPLSLFESKAKHELQAQKYSRISYLAKVFTQLSLLLMIDTAAEAGPSFL